MNPETMRTFLEPKSVAIAGASDDGMKTSGRTLRYLGKYGYEGRVFPVNPRRDTVQGLKAYPSLEAIDRPVDLLVVATAASLSPEYIRSAVELGIPSVIMFPSGFAELNEEGARLQNEIAEMVAGSRTRVLGPNCVGIVSVRSKLIATINTGMDQDRFDLRDGGTAFLTQSGAMGAFILNMSQTRRVGLGSLISTGNEMDISFPEMLHALIDDPKVKGVLGYIEGIRQGDEFVAALDKARVAGKPLGFLKVGRSSRGRDAIASHTGALAGADAVYSGLFEQFGVTRITGIDALADWAQMVESTSPPQGNRLSVATTSGGGGVLVADHCEEMGLELAQWEGEWQDRLREVLPAYASPRNPIDMTGAGGSQELFRATLELMAEHPGTDIIFPLIGNLEQDEEPLLEVIRDVHAATSKPLIVVWVGGSGEPVRQLTAEGIAAYGDPGRALEALRALRASAAARRPSIRVQPQPRNDRVAQAKDLIARVRERGASLMNEAEAKQLLALYELPVVWEAEAEGPEQAAALADDAGGPVVLKLLHDRVSHKSELGGVVLNLRGADEVRQAAKDMLAGLPDDLVDGARLLIQEMVPEGVELLLGITRDTAFGPVLAIGSGGTLTELLSDVSLRVPPVGRDDVAEALDRLRARELLNGFRGVAPRDADAVVDTMVALSRLAMELEGDIDELDVNPLIVGAKGEGARVVDAVIALRTDPGAERADCD